MGVVNKGDALVKGSYGKLLVILFMPQDEHVF